MHPGPIFLVTFGAILVGKSRVYRICTAAGPLPLRVSCRIGHFSVPAGCPEKRACGKEIRHRAVLVGLF